MSHRWGECPDDYEVRRQAQRDAEDGWRRDRYSECPEAADQYRRAYYREESRLEEEREEARYAERRREEKRQEEAAEREYYDNLQAEQEYYGMQDEQQFREWETGCAAIASIASFVRGVLTHEHQQGVTK